MQVIKAVSQRYHSTPELIVVLDEFRKMINDCVRIGLQYNITSRLSLVRKAYPELKRYSLPSAYKLMAVSKACGLISNYRRILKRRPYAKKPFSRKQILVDYYLFKIEDGYIRLTLEGKRNHIYIKLNEYVLRSISGYTVRSVTLTTCTLVIAYSKETAEVTNLTGLIGIDRNLDNVTTANLEGKTTVYDLSEATKTKAVYREVRSHLVRNDDRIRKEVCGKYGKLQRDKVQDILHNTSKKIVEDAIATNSGIVMEELTGIRKLYQKGNGQGSGYRGRMNSWSYFELQRQIEYKAKWNGIPVIYVKPQKTSSICAICGSSITECTERKVWCGNCMKLVDRDENAALNIVKRGRSLAPNGLVSEAMKGNEQRSVVKENSLLLLADTSKSDKECLGSPKLSQHLPDD